MSAELTFNRFVAPLFEGPLDIVGDIHGEIDALNDLLQHMGYAEDGTHPEGRRVIFVGDVVDRGPDSPAVLRKVQAMVDAGLAQCILGNHELNLLRDDEKHGNSWWTAPEKDTAHPAAKVSPDEKAAFMQFLESLPLALERSDLRVVHACWHHESIEALRTMSEPLDAIVDVYHDAIRDMMKRMKAEHFVDAVKSEWAELGPLVHDRNKKPVYMPAKAELDSRVQMENPIAVLTSGVEMPAYDPFWAGGKWRMVQRVRWWEGYRDDVPVVVGHYWRRPGSGPVELMDKYGPDLFDGIEHNEWMGPNGKVFCVDYSVGARPAQRAQNLSTEACKLVALRFPELAIIDDAGETIPLERQAGTKK